MAASMAAAQHPQVLAAHLCHRPHRQGHEVRRVGPAAVRRRGEVRRIGLDQHPVPRRRSRARRAAVAAFLKVDSAGEAEEGPRSRQRRANAASPEKQCITHRSGGPSLSQHPEHVVVRVAVVDDQRLVQALGQVDVPAEAVLLRGPTLGVRCGSGRARSPPPPGPARGSRAPRSRPSAARAHRARPGAAPRWGAARPRPPPTRCAVAASTAQRAPGRSQPIWTMRVTLTAAAAASASSVLSHSPSAMSR